MKTSTADLVSISDANQRGISNLASSVAGGRRLVLLRNSKPAAVMADVETMDCLERVEEMEDDLRLLSIAWVRTTSPSAPTASATTSPCHACACTATEEWPGWRA